MIPFIKQIVGAKSFHHFIVAVIVLAGVVAGLETSPVMMERHRPILLGLDKFILGVFIVEATLEDELRTLEQELKETQTRLAGLRRKRARAGAPAAGERKPEENAA